MLQLLKCAKGLSLQQQDTKVDLQHLYWATELLTFLEADSLTQLMKDLRQHPTSAPEPCPATKADVEQLLSAAAAAPALPLSATVAELVKRWGGTVKPLT